MSNENQWRKIILDVEGEITVLVRSPLVIEIPADATDDEIAHLPEDIARRLAEYANEWKDDYYGLPEDADCVSPTGSCEISGDTDENAQCRLVRAADGKLEVDPEWITVVSIAEEIVRQIVRHQEDHRLKWEADGRVRILTWKVLPPQGTVVKESVFVRLKRFRSVLSKLLTEHRWRRCGVSLYERC